jgi:uncharacterized damage-inducible protein DinB
VVVVDCPISRVNRLQPTLQKLSASQEGFLRAADGISATQWQREPVSGGWSAAELVGHLCQVERGVLSYADRVIRKAPLSVSFFKRWHLPIAVVESRIVKRQAPGAVQPAEVAGKETMLADLRSVRERTLAFLEETHQRDLACYYWRHPFLGNLNFYQWFTFVAAHQARHTKQMLEIAKNLPKGVASAQKESV